MRDGGTKGQKDGATGRRGDGATDALSNTPSISSSPCRPVAPSPRRPVVTSLLVIWAEGFLSRLSFGVISFALPIFAYKRLGLSLTQTGFLFSLNLIAEQLFKPLMGWVADRAGLKRTLTVAIALRSVVALL